jgi:DNA polymerase IV
LPGVGPATADRLHKYGIHTIGELARLPVAEVESLLGHSHGSSMHAYANGIDPRELEPERDTKSVSAETTFETDLTDRRHLEDLARRLSARVTSRLAADGICGRTVTIKIRKHDFTTLTRSFTLGQPTDSAKKIAATAVQLLGAIDTTEGIRLLGVGVSGLSEYAQQDLLAALEAEDAHAGTEPEPDTVDDAPLRPSAARIWTPGQDVTHTGFGPGWVQGTGLGRVTIRFEGPHTPPGPIKTFAVHDEALAAAAPPLW